MTMLPVAARPLIESDISALHSLAEAATALTQLVSSPPRSKRPRECDKTGPYSAIAAVQTTEGPGPRRVSPSPSHCSLDSKTTAPMPPSRPVPAPKTTAASAALVAARPTAPTRTRAEIFPLRLMRMLSDPSLRSVISWLPHGQSFVVLQPDLLAQRALPVHFPETGGSSAKNKPKYASFARKLNRWGFRQVTEGTEAGAFHHGLFQRGRPDLCMGMECARTGVPKSVGGQSPPSAKRMRVPLVQATEGEGVADLVHQITPKPSPAGHKVAVPTLPSMPLINNNKQQGPAYHHQLQREVSSPPMMTPQGMTLTQRQSLDALRASLDRVCSQPRLHPHSVSASHVHFNTTAHMQPHTQQLQHKANWSCQAEVNQQPLSQVRNSRIATIPSMLPASPCPKVEAKRAAEEHKSLLYQAFMDAVKA